MQALVFIVWTLLGLYEVALLLRLLLQLARADFRNPIARALVRITNPVIVPLRRVLPPMGRVDTASVLAVILAAAVKVTVVQLLQRQGLPDAVGLLLLIGLDLVRLLLQTYFFAILLYAVLSLVAPGTSSPAQSLLAALCEPLLSRIRRVIPPIAELDLSPLWAGIAIQALLLLLPQ